MNEEKTFPKSQEDTPPPGMKFIPLFDSPEALGRWILEQLDGEPKE